METLPMQIDWNKTPLIPAIAQDHETSQVLMLAYMNQEAYNLTLSTGYAHYFSRSKQRIWKKGESSNHTQEVKDVLLDCDADTVIVKIKQNGVACHTGRKSCFFTSVMQDKISFRQRSEYRCNLRRSGYPLPYHFRTQKCPCRS